MMGPGVGEKCQIVELFKYLFVLVLGNPVLEVVTEIVDDSRFGVGKDIEAIPVKMGFSTERDMLVVLGRSFQTLRERDRGNTFQGVPEPGHEVLEDGVVLEKAVVELILRDDPEDAPAQGFPITHCSLVEGRIPSFLSIRTVILVPVLQGLSAFGVETGHIASVFEEVYQETGWQPDVSQPDQGYDEMLDNLHV